MALVYEHFKQPDVTMDTSSQRWTIFSSMFDAVNEKEQRKLRFTKCSGCNRTNLYKLANLERGTTEILCRKCGTKISIQKARVE
jgi:hypothetical protein